MTRRPTREEAARALGVTVGADPDACKRAYRRLVREHHPDVGGDPARFHDLQAAYERLVSEHEEPREPVVARGRPSRPPVPFVDEAAVTDLGALDWDLQLPADPVRLDRDRVAAWLSTPGPGGMVRSLAATSRAPGSRLNRVSHLLSPELTSRLRIGDTRDDRGRAMVAIEVVGGNRRARRALDRVAITGDWVRTRRSTTTVLRATLTGSPDPRATALRASGRLADLLATVRWPLDAWTLDRT